MYITYLHILQSYALYSTEWCHTIRQVRCRRRQKGLSYKYIIHYLYIIIQQEVSKHVPC